MKRGTPQHPKMLMLAANLKRIGRKVGDETLVAMAGTCAVGIMEMLWHWTGKYAIQGNVGKWPNEVIADSMNWRHDPDDLIAAIKDAGWLDDAPEPHRLVIHDVQDHADNTWRQNLVDAGLTWWDGSPPRRGSVGRPKGNSQMQMELTPEKLQNNSSEIPQPEPEPEPEPEPAAMRATHARPPLQPPPPLPEVPEFEAYRSAIQSFMAPGTDPPDDAIVSQVIIASNGAPVEAIVSRFRQFAKTRREPPKSYGFWPPVIGEWFPKSKQKAKGVTH